jgi:hypothetical protein
MTFQADWQKTMEKFFQSNVFQTPSQKNLQNPFVCSINAEPKVLSEQIERLSNMKNWLTVQIGLLDQQIQMLSSQMNTINAIQQMQNQWKNHWEEQVYGKSVNPRKTVAQKTKKVTTKKTASTLSASQKIAKEWMSTAQKQVGQMIESLKAAPVNKPMVTKAPSKKIAKRSSAKTLSQKTEKKTKVKSKPVNKNIKEIKIPKMAKTPAFAKLKKPSEAEHISIQ